MPDIVDAANRSRIMAPIRRRDTLPARRVRRALHRAEFRFRMHARALPGRPDLVLRKHRAVIVVHGCFWHRHDGCRTASTPSANAGFWQARFSALDRIKDFKTCSRPTSAGRGGKSTVMTATGSSTCGKAHASARSRTSTTLAGASSSAPIPTRRSSARTSPCATDTKERCEIPADRDPPPLPRDLGDGATPSEELALDADDERAIAGAWDRWRERMQGIEDGTRPLPLTRNWWINRLTGARRTLADMTAAQGVTDRTRTNQMHVFNRFYRWYNYFRLCPAYLRPEFDAFVGSAPAYLRPDLDRLMASPNGSDLRAVWQDE